MKTIGDVAGGSVIPALARSAAVTARLLAAGQIMLPRTHVGSRLPFADGGVSVVYLETALRNASTTDPATLVMAFRLRFIGRQPLLHRVFQLESVANTPTFAGFPGFRYKLWVVDAATGTYRGMYEFDGAAQAERYAATLSKLLRLVSQPGSVRYHVSPGVRLDTFLRDPSSVGKPAPSGADAWWRLAQPAVVSLRTAAGRTSG
jgi:hypothetical protein